MEPSIVKDSAVDCSRWWLISNVCMGKDWVWLARWVTLAAGEVLGD